MATIPPSRPAQIQFCTTHIPVWEEHEAAIGLPDGFAEELNTLTQAARDAAMAARAARQASEAATAVYHQAVKAMRAKAAQGVLLIRTHANVTDDVGVLTMAQIDPEKSPTAVPLPTMPINVSCAVESTGAVRVTWDSTGTHGGYFDIFRRLDATPNGPMGGAVGQFVCIGSSGDRSFVDATIPIGTFQAMYQVRACRGTRKGPLSLATAFQFGSVMPVSSASTPMTIKRAA
jgi:hypothetical protein